MFRKDKVSQGLLTLPTASKCFRCRTQGPTPSLHNLFRSTSLSTSLSQLLLLIVGFDYSNSINLFWSWNIIGDGSGYHHVIVVQLENLTTHI